jgi:hypothetical protein
VFGTGLCLKFVREALGFATDPVSGNPPTAADAWNQAPAAERYPGNYNPPPGVPVYWLGGSAGAGHVALSTGNGNLLSTDFGPNGYVGDGRVRATTITEINAADPSLKYQGWSVYLGDTPISSGTPNSSYEGGSSMADSTAPAAASPSGSSLANTVGSALLSPFQAIGSAIEKGALRLGIAIAGAFLVIMALRMFAGGTS